MMLRRFAVGLGLGAGLTGCSTSPTADAPKGPSVLGGAAPLFAEVFARPGEPLAIPFAVTGDWPASAAPGVSGTEGTLDGTWLRLEARPAADRGWLGAGPTWSAAALDEERGAREGDLAVFVFAAPAEGERELDAAGWPLALRDAPGSGWPIGPGFGVGGARWASAEPAGSPFDAWRWSIARRARGASEPAPAADAVGLLARQVSARWRAALERVAAVDAPLAERLTRSLGRSVVFEDLAIPAWSAAPERLARLERVLADPKSAALDLRLAAEAWLADEPRGAAWVIDDGGSDRPALFGLANFTERAATASLSGDGNVEMTLLEPLSVQVAALRLARGERAQRVTAQVGEDRFELDVTASAVPLSPPGLRMGPFVPEWTMPVWLREQAPALDPLWVGAALLQPATGRTGWEVYVECRGVEAAGDWVRIVVGGADVPLGEVRIGADGTVSGEGSCSGARGEVRVETGRWTALVRLPLEALGSELVELGVERVDARGVRSTWPRALGPWGGGGGRVTVDLSAWAGGDGRAGEADR